MCWDPASQYLVSAGGDDRHVRVWHNYPGKKLLLQELKSELPKATSDALKVCVCVSLLDTRGNCQSLTVLNLAETSITDRGTGVSYMYCTSHSSSIYVPQGAVAA